MEEIKSFEVKLLRAQHHLIELQSDINEWFNGDHHTVVHERRGDSLTEYQVRIKLDTLPWADIAVKIGDVVHNIRSTLDHLTFALCDSYTTRIGGPKDFASECQFPIIGDEEKNGTLGAGEARFNRIATPRIRAMDQAAQAVIKAVQPYHSGNDFRNHPLWQLSELSNIDKHRLLHPVVYHFGGVAVNYDELSTIQLHGKLEVSENAVEDDAIVLIYSASPVDPAQEMNVNFQPVLDIAFDESACVSRKNALKLLANIYKFAVNDVLGPLREFVT